MKPESSHPKSRSVLIIGGGAAGWLTAAYMAKSLGTEATGGPQITVLESPEIGIIGVGEGTFPTIRHILRTLGIDEADFMRESHATFKQGIRFDDWAKTPTPNAAGETLHSHYFHPFEAPFSNKEELNLTPYWLSQDEATRKPFGDAVTFQTRVADASLGPKRLHQGSYQGPLNYAYHLDANRFAQVLARFAKGLGVHHLSGLLNDVVLDADGAIDHIVAKEHGILKADLYVDCTGFGAELIGKALKAPFHPISDILFTDRAITTQVPYAQASKLHTVNRSSPPTEAPLPSYTISTAHEAGWTWDIGLPERRGIGYVYSSRFSTPERAEEILRGYIGADVDLSLRHIQFEAGYRTQQWVKNCVAIGLSAGFLEPLESTGLVMIESAVSKIVEFFPYSGPLDASADIFNDLMIHRYTTIISFIKLHYCLSQRTEPFWVANTDPDSIPEPLRNLLKLWKLRPPSRFDFVIDYESFPHFSYQYILYGMGFKTDYEAARAALPMTDTAAQIFNTVTAFGEQATRDLPDHRKLIKAIYKSGFSQPIPSAATAKR